MPPLKLLKIPFKMAFNLWTKIMTGKQICYCFNYTTTDIEKDAQTHGRSTIMERILSEKKAER